MCLKSCRNNPQTLTQCLTCGSCSLNVCRGEEERLYSQLGPSMSGGWVQIGVLWAIPTDGAGYHHQADARSDMEHTVLFTLTALSVGVCALSLTPRRLAAPVLWPLPLFIWLSLYIKLFFSESSLRAEAEAGYIWAPHAQPRVWATAGIVQDP